ncbi:spore germination protein [Lentibacillus sediminis]|uniref:spore germination protein n=1 Tax=Lentibacillus sediminis TaxID=1940529 RepID=UPI000C1B7FDD|nr:spore germination protein [Lentibacillus sediminis]
MRLGAIFKKKNKQKSKDSGQENFTVDIEKNLDKNLANLRKMLEEPNDLVVREVPIGNTRSAVVYIEGMIDKAFVHKNILNKLQEYQTDADDSRKILEEIFEETITVADVQKGKTLDDAANALLSGSTVVYIDGARQVLIMGTRGWETRAIEKPTTESALRGPKEGFVESLRTNMTLVRRQIRDPNLRFKTYYVGRRSKKKLVLSYVDGVIHPDIVKELHRRLQSIDMDFAPESGYIEQWIEDSFLSPFPQISNTERPDKVAAALLQGKAAIILDGTPFVLLAPVTLGSTLQSPDDYYERWTIGTLLRTLRYGAAFIAIFLPGLYIALASYHPGMIPSDLAFSIGASRQGVPFPAFIEALLMSLTMELLREAGARLPRNIGQTIGIVGGLVIGEAAVTAGIVSPIMVIVVALNAIASFAIPEYSVAISFRILLFGFMIAAAFLGLYGIILAYIMVNIHIVNLKSVGVPYSAPFAPSFFRDWTDLVLRLPVPLLTTRPKYLQTNDRTRTGKGDTDA